MKLISLLVVAIFSFPSMAVAQNTDTEKFVSDISRCSSGMNMNISSDLDGSLYSIITGQGASGSASVSFDSFITLFDPKDRLAAYKIYTNCLSSIYKTSSDGRTIYIGATISDNKSPNSLGDVGNKTVNVKGFFEGTGSNSNRERVFYNFKLSSPCSVYVSIARNNEVREIYPQVYTEDGRLLLEGGTNFSKKSGSITINAGQYMLAAQNTWSKIGFYSINLHTNCR